ncbi:NACHT domain-containing protein [Streptomyces sp. NPDC002574]|uniref:NACHT domain-containing protein n=1 Tax=Streptomyces sp. NPDC002574 TaxID=3364652 RepID=UPI003698F1E2
MAIGGRRDRRVWQAVGWAGGAAVVVLVVITVRQLTRGDFQPQDAASLWGLPIGLAGLLVAVLALRKPPEDNTAVLVRTWAATLATLVAAGEGRVYAQLLGDDTVPIDLSYTLQPAPGRTATAPPHGRLLSTPVPPFLLPRSHPVGGAPDVAAYWRQVRPQRMVVTGPAGSGKTVFALALILALLKDRADVDPVPVRLPVSLWDTTTPLDLIVTQRLIEAYGWPKAEAATLVEHGMVLPVLDGLDEMDPTLPDGTPDPDAPRARAVLQHLDAHRVRGEPGPVVLTCRTAHLEALAGLGTLRDSARIALAPVTPTHAITYLTTRAQDRTRWQPLIDHLTMDPSGPLGTLLSTPWRLCLTATVYHHDGNPHELTSHATAQALDDHLLARFIPAATRLYPHPHSSSGRNRAYRSDQVHRWLHHLTHGLTPATGAPTPAGAGSDLVLHELWPLAGRTRVRIIDAILTTTSVVLLTIPLAWSIPDRSLAVFAMGLFAVVFALMGATAHPAPPSRLGLSRPAVPGRTVMGALAFGFTLSLVAQLMGWLVSALLGVLVVGLWAGMEVPPAREARPWGLLRDDLALKLTLGLVVALVGGLAVTLTFRPVTGLAFGLVTLLAFALTSAVVRRYAVFLLCTRGRMPFRLVVFLDWACGAGLLRYAGPAYQFRHRELQQWLANHREPATLRPGT